MAEGERFDATIVFHDGDCGLCRRSIVFLAERDRKLRLRFAPLQGPTARQLLPASLRELGPLASVVVREADGQIHLRSAAAGHALRLLPWPWRGLGLLCGLAVLRPVLDRAYGVIAARRERWFGKPRICAVSPRLRARSLP